MAEVQYACDVRNKFGDCMEIEDPLELLRQMEEASKHKEPKPKSVKTAKAALIIKDCKPAEQAIIKQPGPVKKNDQRDTQQKPDPSTKKSTRNNEVKTQHEFDDPIDQGFAEIQRKGRRGPRFADESVNQRNPRRGGRGGHDGSERPERRQSPEKKIEIGQVSLTFKRGGGGRARRSFGDGRPYQRPNYSDRTGEQAEEKNEKNDFENLEGGDIDGRAQGRRRFDGRNRGEWRGRRTYERHSGSTRSGVKPEEKRQGGGSHNWGKEVQILDDNGEPDLSVVSEANEGDEGKEVKERSPSPIQMTLDEWKEMQKAKAVEQVVDRRKPGEGDPTKWDEPSVKYRKKPEDMAKYEKLQRKSPAEVEEEEVEEEEVDKTSEFQKSVSKYLFTDSRRVRGFGRNRQANRRYERKPSEHEYPIPQPSDFPALR